MRLRPGRAARRLLPADDHDLVHAPLGGQLPAEREGVLERGNGVHAGRVKSACRVTHDVVAPVERLADRA